jgi:hypothetical protein
VAKSRCSTRRPNSAISVLRVVRNAGGVAARWDELLRVIRDISSARQSLSVYTQHRKYRCVAANRRSGPRLCEKANSGRARLHLKVHLVRSVTLAFAMRTQSRLCGEGPNHNIPRTRSAKACDRLARDTGARVRADFRNRVPELNRARHDCAEKHWRGCRGLDVPMACPAKPRRSARDEHN